MNSVDFIFSDQDLFELIKPLKNIHYDNMKKINVMFEKTSGKIWY